MEHTVIHYTFCKEIFLSDLEKEVTRVDSGYKGIRR